MAQPREFFKPRDFVCGYGGFRELALPPRADVATWAGQRLSIFGLFGLRIYILIKASIRYPQKGTTMETIGKAQDLSSKGLKKRSLLALIGFRIESFGTWLRIQGF